MENQSEKNTFSLAHFQQYIPIGYLYLLILGITSDSIFYSFLGINSMRYSNVLDVLLSPIVHLTNSIIFPVFVLFVPLISYGILRLIKYRDSKVADNKKSFLSKISHISSTLIWLSYSLFLIMFVFVGYGIGGGYSIKERMESNSLKPNHILTFNNNESSEVYIVGNNGTYLFYVKPGEKLLSVSPIQSNIKEIKRLK